MRTWRAHRRGLDEADRLVAGDRAGPESPGLDHLLDAVRAPGTAGELGNEQEMVAALAAQRRRAALTTRPKGRLRVQVHTSARRIVVSTATGAVLLAAGGTAVAAGTGSLPSGVQQQAHRLFSVLGVPAPRTGPTPPPPSPSRTTSATPSPSPARSPGPAATTAAQTRAWCDAWQTAAEGGKPMNGRDRRDLITAAGGEEKVAGYCGLDEPSPTAKPRGNSKSPKATPSHPAPRATTPSKRPKK
ncbi:hypothetical protein [Paractinoplanes deccanensis]|nr:hypothetical protein [Actinoplanes deccanensis]